MRIIHICSFSKFIFFFNYKVIQFNEFKYKHLDLDQFTSETWQLRFYKKSLIWISSCNANYYQNTILGQGDETLGSFNTSLLFLNLKIALIK